MRYTPINYLTGVMIRVLGIVASLFMSSMVMAQGAIRPTVVELFTSQGCSSCPPADAALKALRDRPGILTLSWPVDYWDRLGWEDTFAHPHNAMRQAAYNKRFGRGGVFTPQMVFDGRSQCVGSNLSAVNSAVSNAQAEGRMTISPTLTLDGSAIHLELPETDVPETISLVTAWYLSDATVEIGDGENQGRTLHYTNVVRLADMLPDWDGSATTITIDLAPGIAAGADHLAVLMHEGYYHGPIVGAAVLTVSANASP